LSLCRQDRQIIVLEAWHFQIIIQREKNFNLDQVKFEVQDVKCKGTEFIYIPNKSYFYKMN